MYASWDLTANFSAISSNFEIFSPLVGATEHLTDSNWLEMEADSLNLDANWSHFLVSKLSFLLFSTGKVVAGFVLFLFVFKLLTISFIKTA